MHDRGAEDESMEAGRDPTAASGEGAEVGVGDPCVACPEHAPGRCAGVPESVGAEEHAGTADDGEAVVPRASTEDRFSRIEAIAEAAKVFVDARYNLDFYKTSQQACIDVVGTLAEHERVERLACAQLKEVVEA